MIEINIPKVEADADKRELKHEGSKYPYMCGQYESSFRFMKEELKAVAHKGEEITKDELITIIHNMSDSITLSIEMDNSKKIEISKDFVSSHKNSNIKDWQPVGGDDADKWLTVYDNLEQGYYGEVRETAPNEFEIEIAGNERHTGNAYLFTWET